MLCLVSGKQRGPQKSKTINSWIINKKSSFWGSFEASLTFLELHVLLLLLFFPRVPDFRGGRAIHRQVAAQLGQGAGLMRGGWGRQLKSRELVGTSWTDVGFPEAIQKECLCIYIYIYGSGNQKTGIPKWLALVSGNMNQNLRLAPPA